MPTVRGLSQWAKAPMRALHSLPLGRCVANSAAAVARVRISVSRFPWPGDFLIAMTVDIRPARMSHSLHTESKNRMVSGTGERFRASFRAWIDCGSGGSPVTDRAADRRAGEAARQLMVDAISASLSMARQSRRTCASSSGPALSTTSRNHATEDNSTPSSRSGAGKPSSGSPASCLRVCRTGEPGLSSRLLLFNVSCDAIGPQCEIAER